MTALNEWQNFYVIVGSAAGALIGLQFVVIALIAGMPKVNREIQTGQTYMTPTMVHFGAALLLAAAMTVPWHEAASVLVVPGLAGALGVVYALIVTRRLRRQSGYKPEFEDWLFHSVLPLLAYFALVASACVGLSLFHEALFGVAGAAVLLLFIGIHNAWDMVTFHVFVKKADNPGGQV